MKDFKNQTEVVVGTRYVGEMPYSEACMHLGVSGKVCGFELLENNMVQLYRMNGEQFSFPITAGEAGLYQGDTGYYYYPVDQGKTFITF